MIWSPKLASFNAPEVPEASATQIPPLQLPSSLAALRIASSIQSTLGRRVTMVELFRYVTVADLASYLDRTAG